MNKSIISIMAIAAGLAVYGQSTHKTTGETKLESLPVPQARKVALIVQNHCSPGATINMQALMDNLTQKLSGSVFNIINPYNAIGSNMNRSVIGEILPEDSAIGLAARLGAEGLISASVSDFLDSSSNFGPTIMHEYSIRITLNLTDVGSKANICGVSTTNDSPRYTAKQVDGHREKYLADLIYQTAEDCGDKLLADPRVRNWVPTPPAPPPPPPPPPQNPNLTLADVDNAIQQLVGQMRTNPVFIANYDNAQKTIGRAPLAIVGGLVDMTGDKSPCANIPDLLAAGSQTVRMTLINSALFDAKDDALVTAITKRIIACGNSPLEDGELMAALKQHGSPDFFVVGDMMYFVDGSSGQFRIRLAMHNLHTGKIIWEGVQLIDKQLVK